MLLVWKYTEVPSGSILRYITPGSTEAPYVMLEI